MHMQETCNTNDPYASPAGSLELVVVESCRQNFRHDADADVACDSQVDQSVSALAVSSMEFSNGAHRSRTHAAKARTEAGACARVTSTAASVPTVTSVKGSTANDGQPATASTASSQVRRMTSGP
jgi:hypothetical protein